MLDPNGDSRGTVARVVALMRALAEAGRDIGVSELAKRLDLPVSTVHRLLKLLIEQGMAEKTRDKRRYRAGLELFRVGALVANQRHRRELIEPVLQRVGEQCGELSFYCLYLPALQKVMAVSRVDGPSPAPYPCPLFEPMSLMWGATGRAILAFLPEQEIAELISKGEPSPATGAPLPPARKLEAELAQIRDRGYAITYGQKVEDAVGLAAPVFAEGCSPVSSLCVTVPRQRFQWKMEPKIAKVLIREAAKLSERFGCSGAQGSQRRGGQAA